MALNSAADFHGARLYALAYDVLRNPTRVNNHIKVVARYWKRIQEDSVHLHGVRTVGPFDDIFDLIHCRAISHLAGNLCGCLAKIARVFPDRYRLGAKRNTVQRSVIGILAGVFAKWGWMRNWWNAVASGLICGLVAALLATPILTVVYGNIGNKGTDLFNQVFQSLGLSSFMSNLVAGIFSDPLDKIISFLVVWGLLKLIPRGLKERYRPIEEAA